MGGTQALAACLHATPHRRAQLACLGDELAQAPIRFELKLDLLFHFPASFASRASGASEASEARALCAYRLAVIKFGLNPEARRQCAPREKKIWILGPETARFQGRE